MQSTTDLNSLRERLVEEKTTALNQYYLARNLLEEAEEKIKAASQRIQTLDLCRKQYAASDDQDVTDGNQ